MHDDEIPRLAKQHQHPLSLADLVRYALLMHKSFPNPSHSGDYAQLTTCFPPTRHGRPPLTAEALLQSANFSLSLIPIRLAHRLQALRNLPYIVVSNPNIAKIFQNYKHSLSTLLPWKERTITTLDDEISFTEVLAELVATHQDTIPVLAQGFLSTLR